MSIVDRISRLTATFFGAGYAPKAPGTAGTFAALPLYFLLRKMTLPRYLMGIGILTLLGAASSARMEAQWGKDPSRVVIDEVVGFLIALVSRPKGIKEVFLAFVLFRLFDIIKPPPVSTMESLPGGVGIMADDMAAGALSALVLAGVRKTFKIH